MEKKILEAIGELRKDIHKRLDSVKDDLTKEIGKMSECFAKMGAKVNALDERLAYVCNREILLEIELKRRYLVIFGLADEERESPDSRMAKIRNLLHDDLNLHDMSDNDIDTSFRIGQYSATNSRVVKLVLVRQTCADRIMSATGKLKGKKCPHGRNVFIKRDLPAPMLNMEKQLIGQIKEARKKREKVGWRGLEFYIGGKSVAKFAFDTLDVAAHSSASEATSEGTRHTALAAPQAAGVSKRPRTPFAPAN